MDINQEYDKVVEITNRDTNLLFQRLNFFLIGSAFLITGFATLVVYRGYDLSGHTLILSYIINFMGLYLSILFTIANYINARTIWHLGRYIRYLENENKEENYIRKPFNNVQKIIVKSVLNDEFRNNYLWLILKLFFEIWNFLFNLSKASEKGTIPHTYMIPLGFTLFWLIVLFSVLPINWAQILILIPPGIYIIYSSLKLVKRDRKPVQTA